jgi:uncharacterized repeat protein (TIGR03803 family)
VEELERTTPFPRPPRLQSFTVLHTFRGGAEGASPNGGLVRDEEGNLYGTTAYDGDFACNPLGCGTVFKLDPSGTLTTLHVFAGGPIDGASPYAGLMRDDAGNLFGTTAGGGAHQFGTVFKLNAMRNETVLYHFTGGADGGFPSAGVIRDDAGSLYGVTGWCGEPPCSQTNMDGSGTIFKVDPSGAFTTLHTFAADLSEGVNPQSSLIRDMAGNLYGMTFHGGNCFLLEGCGTVFKLDPSGALTTLHAFNGTDGESPLGPLIQDEAGNLYGTTAGGGAGIGGTVFKLDANGQLTTLHAFFGGDGGEIDNDPAGKDPRGGVLRDVAGNLYGTTISGGRPRRGVVFRLNVTTGEETVLHTFSGSDGSPPQGPLVADSEGSLYGTTNAGGDPSCHPPYGCGVVFKIKLPNND